MNFASDNVSPFCPEVLEALTKEASANAPAYGGDEISQKLDAAFSELFGKEVAVIPVATGTAANCISLSALVSPYGGVVCHHEAHINEDESTGVAFFTGGAKLLPMDGPAAKLDASDLDAFIADRVDRGVHSVSPECVAITQATELGAVYSIDEVKAIGEVCRKHDLRLFMDGARFANAMAHLKCHPADVTWKAGVDAISFGATKNGAMAVDAIVLFDSSLKSRVEQARKRSGHLHSSIAIWRHSFWPISRTMSGSRMPATQMKRHKPLPRYLNHKVGNLPIRQRATSCLSKCPRNWPTSCAMLA